MHLMPSHYNKSQRAKSSCFYGVEDDYGESDLSLVCYKRDFDSPPCTLSLDEANELLYENLKEYVPFTINQTIDLMVGFCPPPKRFTFTVGHNLRVKVQIRMDVQRILFSTVVLELEHQQRDRLPPRRMWSYSLLTKIMKFNAILGRTTRGGRVVSTHEGKCVFFQDVGMSTLHGTKRCGKLSDMIEDFLLKAMEIRLEISTHPRMHGKTPVSGGSI